MNNLQPEDVVIHWKQGDTGLTLGEMREAYQNMKLLQSDVDILREKLADSIHALSVVCTLVVDTVGIIPDKDRTEKERELVKAVETLGFKNTLNL